MCVYFCAAKKTDVRGLALEWKKGNPLKFSLLLWFMLRWFNKQLSESGSQTLSDSIAKWCSKYATLHLQHLKRQLSCLPCHRRLVHQYYAMAWDVFTQHNQQFFLDLQDASSSRDRAHSSCCFGGARTWPMDFYASHGKFWENSSRL